MSTLKTNRIENLSTTDGGISINNSGQVGINTSSPSALLDVNGQARFGGNKVTLGTDGSIGGTISNSTTRAFVLSNTDVNADYFGGRVIQIGPDGTVNIGGSAGTNPASYTSPTIKLNPGGSSYLNGGNVGIGTSSPGSYDSSASNLVVGSASGDEGITIAAGTSSSSTINFADGTSGSAAYTGRILYQHSADALTLHTNGGLERVRIDSSGKVGIGTSPQRDLHIHNASSSTNTYLQLTSSATGTGSTDGFQLWAYGAHHSNQNAVICQRENAALEVWTNNAERMRLDENGLVSNLVGGNSTNYKIRNTAGSSSSIYFIECLSGASGVTSGGTHRFLVATNGGISNYQSNDTNLCDEREKKNIETLNSTWSCLKNWELKKFHYNEDADTDDKRYGVIAQQVEQHCPELISDWTKQRAEDAVLDEDGNVVTPAKEEILRKGVKEQQMMWMAIKALQEAQTRIETLEAEVAALKSN